jgi:protein-S-isoprenylcysteine O-methyltransferase Ste14
MEPTAEYVYRIVFGVLWLLYFVARLFFQGKVKGLGWKYQRVNEKQESLYFRLFAFGFILLVFYFLTPWIDFARLPLPAWQRWLGAALTLAGIALFTWSHYILGKNWTAVLALSENHKLVTGGPYKVIRHPMYTAFFAIGVGFLLLSANLLVGILYLGTLSLMYFIRVGAEEKMMLAHFGEPYREYMRHTGRVFPRLWK